jgi:hypothetical protein
MSEQILPWTMFSHLNYRKEIRLKTPHNEHWNTVMAQTTHALFKK